ncbi:zinc finger protein 185 isoform X2 [Hoplias malabaricus]|uniref:zinc finger protein 185 isoform X2 n=1 Tax=Hoplias malabaricus TaxID=27720 RepID=UPI003462BD65
MSKEGDRQSVLRKTKVRTTLKNDNSWIQRRRDPDQEEEVEEKPWLAEVRAGRLNGAFNDAALENTPTQPEPESQPKPSTDSPKTPTSGYLIRGVFTKTDNKPAPQNPSNGHIGTSGFNKKPSEAYKKIAPHTVRTTVESPAPEKEPTISKEEQDRRTEVASNALKTSAARQRSYVLSAAKKYEAPPEKPNSSEPPVISFVAKRVIITDDEDSDPVGPKAADLPAVPSSPAPQSLPAAEQSVPDSVTQVAPVAKEVPTPAAEPKPKAEPVLKPSVPDPIPAVPAVQITPSTPTSETDPVPAAPAAKKPPATPTPAPTPKAEPTPTPSVTEPIPAAQNTPSIPAPAATPAPTTKAEPVLKPSVTEPIPAAQKTLSTPTATPAQTPKAEPAPKPSVTEPIPAVPAAQKTPSTPTPTATPKTEPTPKPRVDTKLAEKTKTLDDDDLFGLTQSVPAVPGAPKTPSTPKPTPTPKTEPTPKPRVDTNLAEKTKVLGDDELFGLTQSSPQNPMDSLPSDSELLIRADRYLPKSEKTQTSLDLLAVDVIPIDTNTDKLSTDKTMPKIETTQTVVQSKDTNSSSETVTIKTTKTEVITPNRYLPKSKKTQTSLDLLAFDVIPIDTNTDKLSTDKTMPKIETTQTVVQSKDTNSSSETVTIKTTKTEVITPNSSLFQSEKTQIFPDFLEFDDTTKDKLPDKTKSKVQTTTVEETKSPVELFDPLMLDSLSTDTSKQHFDSSEPSTYQRSSDKTSPWDRWTSPILNTATEIRETKADPDPMESTYTAYTRRMDRSVLEPQDTDSKKNLVYVKEYVNTPGHSTYSSSDLDYVTSTSSSYAYSSPPSTNMTACTYCGGFVGNDAKITIEHLNISCHPDCFKCGICSKPMGDFIHNMFLHRGTVHCESCYANLL